MKKLNDAIIKVQTELSVVAKKSGKNIIGKGYNYFTETDLYNALKPLMKKENIGYTIGFKTLEKNTITTEKEYYVEKTKETKKTITTMYEVSGLGELRLFKDDEEKIIPIIYGATNTDVAKAIGSALTYATRYWLCKEFGVPTDELDPDTTENSNKMKEINEKEINKGTQAVAEVIKPATQLTLLEQVQLLCKNDLEVKENIKNFLLKKDKKLIELSDKHLEFLLENFGGKDGTQ